jgi:hypothetical protein
MKTKPAAQLIPAQPIPARSISEQVIGNLVEIMNDRGNQAEPRVKAAEIILRATGAIQ